MALLIICVALLGLAVGSFLNVVIHRVPLHKSLSRPPSHCPGCDQRVRFRHNIPIIGWLLLRGRCADCKIWISVRYPIVELLTAIMFIAISVQLDHLRLLPALPAYLFFCAVGIALAAIDIDVHRLPNIIVLPAYPVLILLFSAAAIAQQDPGALLRAAVGAVGLFAVYFLLAFAYPAGMGFGDVKLAGVVGGVLAFLSYPALLVGAFAAFLIGAIVGVLAIVSRRSSLKGTLPFGPFMIAGALIAVFASVPIADFYEHLVLIT